MKKSLLMKSLLLLFALVVGTGSSWADDYVLFSGAITEGDYVIVYDGVAMKNTVSSNRLQYESVTITDGKISNPGGAIVWHIAASGEYWTIFNNSVSKYAAGTGTKNQAGLLVSGTDDKSLWTVTGSSTYEFVNKKNNASNVNKNLRYNSGYGFACYATGTGGALSLYKKAEAAGAATTVTINSTGLTNANLFLGTAAGTLTAAVTVTATSAAVDGSTVTWSSSNTSVATVGETTGVVTLVGEGSTTITASYAGKTNEYKSSSAEYVLNVINEDPNAVTLWSEDFSGYSDGAKPSDGTYSYVCVDGSTSTKIYNQNNSGGTAPELLVNKNGGSFSATIPLDNCVGILKLTFKSNDYAVTVSTSTDGISVSGDNSFNTTGEHTVTFTGVTTLKTSVTITFSAGTSNVRIDDIVLKGTKAELVPVTINAVGLATFASDEKLDFTNVENLEAYIATTDGSKISLTKKNIIPANTGVLLRAKNDATAFNVPVTTVNADNVDGNLFVRGTGAPVASSEGGNYNYVLGKHNGEIGFYKAGGMTVATDKAYIQTTLAAARFAIDFENEDVTAIEAVKAQKNDGQFYNLAGQRVAQPTKGMYIVNGKKVVIK